MLTRLIGDGTTAAQLKGGLDSSTRAVRGIAHRIANASTPDTAGTPAFSDVLEAAEAAGTGEGEALDLEREMVALADEQLRYETAAGLLQKIYQQIRHSVSER